LEGAFGRLFISSSSWIKTSLVYDESSRVSCELTVLEHARLAPAASHSLHRQDKIIRRHWRLPGDKLLKRFPGIAPNVETLDALLHEIAYAPRQRNVAGRGALETNSFCPVVLHAQGELV
jgi:hypothetical protein